MTMRLPWRLNAPQSAPEIVQFPFIRQFLAFRHLDELQNFVNALH